MPDTSKINVYKFPLKTYPEWSDIKSIFPDIQYELTGETPSFGKASFYGKFDGEGLTDYTSCREMSVADGRRFNPFKLYIASRDLKKGSFVKVSLLDNNKNSLKNNSGENIYVIAEVVDWGPGEASGRDFDLSYGIAEYFSSEASDQIEYVKNGKIIKGDVNVCVENVLLGNEDVKVLRAFTFYHKITEMFSSDESKKTWCLNIEEKDGEYWVTPSVGDKYTVGWEPPLDDVQLKKSDFCDYDKCKCILKSVYQFCEPKVAKQESLSNRYKIMSWLGIPDYLFKPYGKNVGGQKCYGSDIGPLSVAQALYLYELLGDIDENNEYRFAAIQCFPADDSIPANIE